MPAIVERQEPVTLSEPSMDTLRKFVENPDAEVAEPEKETEAEVNLPDAGTGEVQQEPEAEEVEIDLSPKEQARLDKRIAREVEKQAHIDRQIAQAVSARKAKEAELAKLTETGSDPAKTPKPVEDAEPQFPDANTFAGTVEEFQAAINKARTDWLQWHQKQTESTVEAKFQQRDAQRHHQELWNAAEKEFGPDFGSKIDAVTAGTPEPMQYAISALDSRYKIAVHLANNPAEMKALADQFAAHPVGSTGYHKAVAKLGALEDKLTAAAQVKEPPGKPLPPPLKKVDKGTESDSGEFDLSTATMHQKRAWMKTQGLI